MTVDRTRRDVYVIPGFMETSVASLFTERGFSLKSNPDDANILVWTGGADISPDLYNDPRHPMTSFSNGRDKREVELYRNFAGPDYFKIGICRGHQLLAAMNNGKLFQHVNNHGRPHDAFYRAEDGTVTIHTVSSAHHQMMDLYRSDGPFEVWLSSNEASRREVYAPDLVQVGYDDPEAVFWPRSMSVGFQGHPEFGPQECTDLFFKIVDRAYARYEHAGRPKLQPTRKASIFAPPVPDLEFTPAPDWGVGDNLDWDAVAQSLVFREEEGEQ